MKKKTKKKKTLQHHISEAGYQVAAAFKKNKIKNLFAVRLHFHFFRLSIFTEKLNFLLQNGLFFFIFLDFLLVNCQTNWGFPKEWYSTWKWELGALVHYVVLTRLQSSSAGVSLGALRVLNNASYSLSRELISSKLSNQHWRAWRALKEHRVQSDWRLFKKKYLSVEMSFKLQTGPKQQKVTWQVLQKKSQIFANVNKFSFPFIDL